MGISIPYFDKGLATRISLNAGYDLKQCAFPERGTRRPFIHVFQTGKVLDYVLICSTHLLLRHFEHLVGIQVVCFLLSPAVAR